MNAFLLYRDRDFDLSEKQVWNRDTLIKDLGLDILFDAMSNGMDLENQMAQSVLLSSSLPDESTILYRQQILKDCIAHPSVTESLFNLTIDAVESRKNTWYGIFTRHSTSLLSSAAGLMRIYIGYLKKLRDYLEDQTADFRSEGFTRLRTMMQNEVSDEYIDEMDRQLSQLQFDGGILMSAQVGTGNRGTDYLLHSFITRKKNWWQKLFPSKPTGYIFQINPRDEAGAREIAALNDNAVRQVANKIADADEHILHFFTGLRNELAFYMGCLHLHQRLSGLGLMTGFPQTAGSGTLALHATGLYDPCLALSMNKKIATNNLQADGKQLVIITGANKGGKSTFLRSAGTAMLMMQSGMFVGAASMEAAICDGVWTHFKKEEDSAMESGKFDEELRRMDEIAAHLKPFSLLLFNESFAATNEREGSEVARQIVNALIENHNKVFFVTHLYDLSNGYYKQRLPTALFLRANNDDTFQLTESAPEKTSNGIELYHKLFD